MQVLSSPMTVRFVHEEYRNNYEFNPGGVGRIEEFTKFMESNSMIVITAPLKWRYEGANRWVVDLPSSKSYKVLEKKGNINVGYRAPICVTLAYWNGRLYDLRTRRVLVPLSEARQKIDQVRARAKTVEIGPVTIFPPQ